MSPAIKHLSLPDLGLDLKVVMPQSDLDPTTYTPSVEYPAGTILLGTGLGAWQWGERFMVHELNNGNYSTVDLVRGIVQSMTDWEIASSCVAILPPEAHPYPYRTLEEALDASKGALPLFAAPPLGNE